MKIDLNFNIKDLEGKEVENANAGKLIANLLSNSNEGNAVKLIGWALSLHAGEPIDIDKADYDLFKKIVNESKVISNLVKAQVVNSIGDFK